MITIRRYGQPALAAALGSSIVLMLLALADWPGPLAWAVVHVALGGGLSATWAWTQAQATTPVGLVADWWAPVMGAVLVVAPVLAHLPGWLAAMAAAAAVATAAASVWVAADCVERLRGIARPHRKVRLGAEAEERIERLDRVHRQTAAQIDLLDAAASPDVRAYVQRHRSPEAAPPRAQGAAHA